MKKIYTDESICLSDSLLEMIKGGNWEHDKEPPCCGLQLSCNYKNGKPSESETTLADLHFC